MAARAKSDDATLTLFEQCDKQLEKSLIIPNSVRGWISTGCDLIDWCIGYAGIPRGRYTEVYSDFSKGKTLLAIGAARACQALGGLVVYIDTEASLDMPWVLRNHISTHPEVWYHRIVRTLEGVQDMIDFWVDARKNCKEPTLIVWDSLAASLGKAQVKYLEKRAEGVPDSQNSAGVAVAARLNSMFFAGDAGKDMYNSNIAVLIINQTREKIGVMFGDPETTPGGKSTRFYASARVRLSKEKDMEMLPNGGPPLGYFMKASVTKNKLDRTGRHVSLPVYATVGIDNRMALMNYLTLNHDDLPMIGETPLSWKKGSVGWEGAFHKDDAFWGVLRDNAAVYQGFRTEIRRLFFRWEPEKLKEVV